jgi:hypothetical protein
MSLISKSFDKFTFIFFLVKKKQIYRIFIENFTTLTQYFIRRKKKLKKETEKSMKPKMAIPCLCITILLVVL